MSVNETLSKKVYRTLKTIDGSGNKTWNKLAFWTTADQVELENGDNAQDVLESILMKSLTIYVSPSGSDITGTGSSGYPFATITKALSTIPKNLNGFPVYLNVDGGTYNENISIYGFGGARMNIIFRGNSTINGSIAFSDCDCSVQIQSLSGNFYTLTVNNTTNTTAAIPISNAKLVSFISIQLVITSVNNGIYAYGGSSLYVSKSVTLNNCAVAIMSNQGSRISLSEGVSGSGNVVGIRAYSGMISYDDSLFTMSATTPRDLNDGTIITNDLVTQSQIATLGAKIGSKVVVSATAPSDTSAVWVY